MVKHRKIATLEEIKKHFDGPIKDAALRLRMSLSLLKKLCREYGFKKWPYRKISSIQNQIAHLNLKRQEVPAHKRHSIDQEILHLQNEIQRIIQNPSSIENKNQTKIKKPNKTIKRNSKKHSIDANMKSENHEISGKYTISSIMNPENVGVCADMATIFIEAAHKLN